MSNYRTGGRKSTLTGARSTSKVFSLNTAAFLAAIEGKKKIVQEAVRPAAQAAAQVFYDEVLRNVASIGSKSGLLKSSVYQVYSKQNSNQNVKTYHVSWNHYVAPHGHLLEYGWLQRYKVYVGSDGKWHTAVQPGSRGKPKPKRKASQVEKDAYYVKLASPKQHPGYAFIRSAFSAANRAEDAAKLVLVKAIGAK